MIKIPVLLKKTEFRFFVFWAAIIAFNWPFLTIAAQFAGSALFAYLLAAWLIIIVALGGMSFALEDEATGPRRDSGRKTGPGQASGPAPENAGTTRLPGRNGDAAGL